MTQMDSKKLALLCGQYADNKKGENIVILDVRGLSSFTEFFVIVSGTSDPHLRAICDEVIEGLARDHAVRPRAIDGTINSSWIVLDYDDVVVHLMRPELRERYDLERLWGDAKHVRLRRAKPRKK